MRSVIRPLIVGAAVLGLAGFGAASAQANGGGHHKPCCKTNVINKEWTSKSWDHSVEIEVEDSIVFGPMLNKKYDFEIEH